MDLSDEFAFEASTGKRIETESIDGGFRFSVQARLDGRNFEQFVLDVNIAVDDPRPVDRLMLRPILHWAGFAAPIIAAVPIAFHLAEKLHAYVRVYSSLRLWTRVKDLSIRAVTGSAINAHRRQTV